MTIEFTSAKLKDFGKHDHGIKHTLVAPYHPQSNKLEEKGMQFLNNALKRQVSV